MPDAELVIRGGRCVLPSGTITADVGIAAGRITAIGPHVAAARVIDATGKLLLPGAIDAHVHVREPGQTQKEDYAHASRAAAVGGVTTIVSQPNTAPPPTDGTRLHTVAEHARASRVDHAITAGISAASEARDVEALRELGAVGLELLDDPGALDDRAWRHVFALAARAGLPLCFMATDRARMKRAEGDARARGGWRAFAATVTAEAEAKGARDAVRRAGDAGAALVLRQLTTAGGVEALRALKRGRAGAPLWAEANVHHLFLTVDDLEHLEAYGHVMPPLRPAADVEALWAAVNDGTIDFVSTDHAPHTRAEKDATGDPWSTPTGLPGLDTFLPLLLDAALGGRLTFDRLAQLVAAAPARILDIDAQKGALAVGRDADLVIVDPNASWTVREDALFTKCGWSPFTGRALRGRVTLVMVRGIVVSEDGRPVDAAVGRQVRPDRLARARDPEA